MGLKAFSDWEKVSMQPSPIELEIGGRGGSNHGRRSEGERNQSNFIFGAWLDAQWDLGNHQDKKIVTRLCMSGVREVAVRPEQWVECSTTGAHSK